MTRIGPTAAAATLSREAKSAKNATPCGGCRKGLSPDLGNAIRERAAMCVWCTRANPNAKACPADGKHTHVHITVRGCPRGYFPDADGLIRWRWVKWMGVPQPVRDHTWRVKGKAKGKTLDEWRASFPGCGCVRILKAAWLRLKRIGGRNGHQID